ncbi:hypothetical protein LUZ60_016873 [Juncus effusus]|nr:hypothetical protein LUZ60_016873 [Juncus effusus]
MAKTSTLCAMCGDIGFQDKLFQCNRCYFRFQHSYCTNYYNDKTPETANVCDWCLTEERNNQKPAIQNKKTVSSEKIKQSGEVRVKATSASSSASASVSPKPAGRRYKLLKDVLC